MKRLPRRVGAAGFAALLIGAVAAGAQLPTLTAQDKALFLRTAEVVAAERLSTGITKPWRLTLTDGALTHDAVFQAVDTKEDVARLGARRELRFVDSYRYNIAAYELAVLLGLGEMIPVTVEREWKGQTGALSWWIDDVMFDEATRIAQRLRPDDVAAWSVQMARMGIFAELVHDTDRNRTNILYTHDWRVKMIDFSRAFRIWDRLQRPEDLTQIETELFERLVSLSRDELERAVGPQLTAGEINGVLERRDRLVVHFRQLIDRSGEAAVLR